MHLGQLMTKGIHVLFVRILRFNEFHQQKRIAIELFATMDFRDFYGFGLLDAFQPRLFGSKHLQRDSTIVNLAKEALCLGVDAIST
jgi:hypothetical protein